VDHVIWKDGASAQAAAKQASVDPSMAPLMAGIDGASVSFGHYEERP
jgi:hypothetical protein